MPVFVPADSTGYYDQSLYRKYRAQGLKEDLWAGQYYFLLQQSSAPPDNYLMSATVARETDVYAVMTFGAGASADSDEFYREQKLGMAEHIGGGKLTKPVVYCSEPGCSMSFPVNMPEWTADALMNLGL